MDKKLFILVVIAGLFGTIVCALSAQPEGAKEMVLSGGKSGNVAFPHHRHQVSLKDCSSCHKLFPQKKGGIQELQEQNKIKKRQVMNQCRDCHKNRQRSGAKAGPTSCKGCHNK